MGLGLLQRDTVRPPMLYRVKLAGAAESYAKRYKSSAAACYLMRPGDRKKERRQLAAVKGPAVTLSRREQAKVKAIENRPMARHRRIAHRRIR